MIALKNRSTVERFKKTKCSTIHSETFSDANETLVQNKEPRRLRGPYRSSRAASPKLMRVSNFAHVVRRFAEVLQETIERKKVLIEQLFIRNARQRSDLGRRPYEQDRIQKKFR
jgi:hypothetical protein